MKARTIVQKSRLIVQFRSNFNQVMPTKRVSSFSFDCAVCSACRLRTSSHGCEVRLTFIDTTFCNLLDFDLSMLTDPLIHGGSVRPPLPPSRFSPQSAPASVYNRSRKGIAPLSGFAAFIRGFLTLLDTDISIYNTDKIARW